MVSTKVITLGALAATTQAQSLLTPIDFDSTLEAYFYFRDATASIAISADGITVTGDFATTDDVCNALAGAQIVYSADSGSDVLLTSNCYDVYYMETPELQDITWTSCVEFSFYESMCESGSSTVEYSSTVTESSTAVVASTSASVVASTSASLLPETTVSDSETYILTTYTSYESNLIYEYTTYCPLSGVTTAAESSVDVPDYTIVEATETSYVTVNAAGEETTITELVPVTETEGTPSTTVVTITSCSEEKCSIIPVTTGLTVVTTMEAGVVTEYTTFCPLSDETSAVASSTKTPAVSSTSASAASSGAKATTSATASASEGTTVVAQSSSTSAESESTAAAVSTFEGAGAKTVGSMSLGLLIAVVGLMI